MEASYWRTLTKKANHIFLKQTSQVSHIMDVAQPLNALGINGFFYGEFSHQRRSCLVGTRPDWLSFQANNIESHINYSGNLFSYSKPKELYFLSSFGHDKNVTDLYQHQMRSMIYLVKNFLEAHRSEMYVFSSPLEASEGNQALLNQLEVLEQFALYFKEKALPIIKNCRLPSRVLNALKASYEVKLNNSLTLPDIKRYYLGVGYGDAYLTKKQFEVLKLMVQGATAKETARLLYLSPRTVEKHLENMKTQLHCESKQAFVTLISKSNLSHLLFK